MFQADEFAIPKLLKPVRDMLGHDVGMDVNFQRRKFKVCCEKSVIINAVQGTKNHPKMIGVLFCRLVMVALIKLISSPKPFGFVKKYEAPNSAAICRSRL